MKELLLEIGTEEIPAGFVPKALADLKDLVQKELEANRIDFSGVRTLGTPRRIVLLIESVSERQRDEEIRKIGPSKATAFDPQGAPTKAAIGFAKSQSVPVESLEVVKTDKGEYVCAVKREAGKPTFEVLQKMLPGIILAIPFQKSMRWGETSIRFARPIHWVLCLFGGEVVDFELGPLRSGNVTFGHRFMHPEPMVVGDIRSYLEKMDAAKVIVDPEERRKRILEGMIREAEKVSGKVLVDEDLLDEVNFLVEFPFPLCGSFDPKFLSLPREVVIHSMKEHQRYFPVVDGSGELLPHFIFLSNLVPRDERVVVKGNERVLKARLTDAAFFFEEDLKVPLEKRVEDLKKVVFQAKLGTSYEKVMRFKALASYLVERIDPGLRAPVERAAYLCKADLVTGMVGEFPKLQGVMGREYAKRFGESPEVSEALYEHYLPAFSGDRLPSGPVGDIVSMADKLDTIVGCFGVGLVPTGTADPFGLRRQALGIIRIILEKGYPLSLVEMVEEAGRLLGEKLERPFEEVKAEVLDFFRVRFQNLLLDRGYPFDVIDAVLSTSFDQLLDLHHRIEALREARTWKDFESIVIGFKRAMNILKGASFPAGVNPCLFSKPEEGDLYQTFTETKGRIEELLRRKDYVASLFEMSRMKQAIDAFFDGVMVMVEEEAIRNNRLALLDAIGKLFLRFADFSKLA
ncbi:MAG: glycine--tRNA ligase subunit beta [Desulfobacterota bacterium]|nr:glycine--tRNA ligase subunit beta [Thermodesulfobacteriota bacterium]